MADTVEKQVKFRDLLGNVSAFSHSTLEGILSKINVHILEMEDVLFHHNSAVMMPDNPGGKSSKDGTEDDAANPGDVTVAQGQAVLSGVKALAVVFRELQFDENKRIIIAAHTDTSGDVTYNFDLSDLRARNVLYLLTGEKNNWATVSYEKQKVEDYQQVLTWVFKTRRWPCNPAGIDNSWGPNTERATENFINYYNTQYARPNGRDELENPFALMQTIRNDGKKRWPEELWGAVFELYSEDTAETLSMPRAQFDEVREGMTALGGGKFLYETKMYVACGESFPIDNAEKSNYRSQSNRRVEILFFDKDEALREEDFNCPAERGRIHTAEECPLWNGWHFLPLYITPEDLNAVVYHLRFTYFDVAAGQVCNIPAGLDIHAFENGADELETESTWNNGVYSVKVQFKTPLADPAHKDLRFEFRAENKWIYRSQPKSDPRIIDVAPDAIKKLNESGDLTERLKYYDLPAVWTSQNYWARYDGNPDTGDRFETVLKVTKKLAPFGSAATTAEKCLIFSLDDIVLTDENGGQSIVDKNNNDVPTPSSDKSRFSLFYVKGDRLQLYNPEAAAVPYFTKYPFKTNLITDVPADGMTRLIAFANDFYHIFDRRAAQGTDPYNPAKDVRGCRVARRKDAAWHASGEFRGDSSLGHNRYYAVGVGNFELHYVHSCAVISGPDSLKRRSFLLIYWNGVFEGDGVVTANQIKDFATKGLANAKLRWEDKAYTLEPLTPPAKPEDCDIQIVPFFFFEAKRDNLGGKPKCKVIVSNNPSTGWMGVSDSEMYFEDYQVSTPDPTVPQKDNYGIPGADIDGKSCKALTVAHELGHAMGKDDEYSYEEGDIDPGFYSAKDGVFTQYYLGMPYQIDSDSMMVYNRSPRLKHLWPFVNWINDSVRPADNSVIPTKPAGKLWKFLKGGEYRITSRFASIGTKPSRLDFHLSASPRDYRDPYLAFKKDEVDPTIAGSGVGTGTGRLDMGLYKMGEDEEAWKIEISPKPPTAFPFEGILAVYLKICFEFVNGSAGNWTTPVDKTNWMDDVKKKIKELNSRFYFHYNGSEKQHDFKNTYLFLFPVCLPRQFTTDKGVAHDTLPWAHYNVVVTLDNTATVRFISPKTIAVGNKAEAMEVVKVILGKHEGAMEAFFKRLFSVKDKAMREHLGFIEKWFKDKLGNEGLDDNFTLKGNYP